MEKRILQAVSNFSRMKKEGFISFQNVPKGMTNPHRLDWKITAFKILEGVLFFQYGNGPHR
ncbi:hypothetical protein, partial [Thermococcus sp.]|uniref:hypothetical protein n=1 Tax=Thermococcus sp. TaxID=35749 RepID=UPI002637F93C